MLFFFLDFLLPGDTIIYQKTYLFRSFFWFERILLKKMYYFVVAEFIFFDLFLPPVESSAFLISIEESSNWGQVTILFVIMLAEYLYDLAFFDLFIAQGTIVIE